MLTTKLTLSADKRAISEAKRLADSQGTSVSAMFMRFIQAMKASRKNRSTLGPITRRAASIARTSPRSSPRRLLEDALMEKYR